MVIIVELRVEVTKFIYMHTLVTTHREQIGFSTWTLRTWFEMPGEGLSPSLTAQEREEYREAIERLRVGIPPGPNRRIW